MTNYQKGYRNEQKSIEIFESAGYRVIRSGGSFGEIDLVAINSQGIILCQVKTGRWTSPAEEESIRLFPSPSNTQKMVHRWDKYAQAPKVRIL